MAGNPRVLVVDQDFETRAELQKGLVRAQFIVMGGVGYGAEALSLAAELKPSAVLVGVEDPPARALQTIESLTELLPDSPVLAYSSQTDADSARKAVVAGARDYLTKPLKMDEVIKAVQTALAQQERRRALLSGESVTGPRSAGMIITTLLAQTHDFVILDCPATFTDLVAVALDKATIVLLLTSLDITSIKDTTTALKLLTGGMTNEDKIKLVINRATNVNSVREEDVRKVLRREVFWSLPHDEEISASAQLGTPVVIDRPQSRISETIREMAATLAGVEISYGKNGQNAEPAASGLLTRLFKR